MKRFVMSVVLWATVLNGSAYSEVPNKLSYQGLLTGMPDGSYMLKFDIYDTFTGGTIRFTETRSGVGVTNGTFSVTLGSTTALPAIFVAPLYIEITAVSGPSGPTYPLTFSPRSELTSSPYALGPWSVNGLELYHTGGVSIGGHNYTRKLTVIGSTTGTDDYVAAIMNAGNGAGDKGLYITSSGGDILTLSSDNTTPRVVVTHGGAVGIGTTTPLASLQVEGPGIMVSRNGFGNPFTLSKDGNAPFAIFEGGSANEYRFVLDSAGNVGIGTTAPSTKLHVIGNVSWGDGSKTGLLSYGGGGVSMGASSADALQIFAGGAERIHITSGGYVGVGTSVPFAQLHIEATGRGNIGGVGINNSSAGGRMITINQQTPGQLTFTSLMGAVDLMTLDFPNERVGIGTVSPGYKLQVSGTIDAEGLVYSFGVPLVSDQRFKKDVVAISNALDKVGRLHGVSFSWKTDEFPDRKFPKDRQMGFIAQDVEPIVPEVVTTMNDGYKTVDYSKLTPLLVEAVKEQQKEIDELKRLVTQLLAQERVPAHGGRK